MQTKREIFMDKLKRNIDNWNVEIGHFEAKAEQSKTGLQADFRKQVAELKASHHELEAKLLDLQATSEAVWEDVKVGVDAVRQALGDSIESAKHRFN